MKFIRDIIGEKRQNAEGDAMPFEQDHAAAAAPDVSEPAHAAPLQLDASSRVPPQEVVPDRDEADRRSDALAGYAGFFDSGAEDRTEDETRRAGFEEETEAVDPTAESIRMALTAAKADDAEDEVLADPWAEEEVDNLWHEDSADAAFDVPGEEPLDNQETADEGLDAVLSAMRAGGAEAEATQPDDAPLERREAPRAREAERAAILPEVDVPQEDVPAAAETRQPPEASAPEAATPVEPAMSRPAPDAEPSAPVDVTAPALGRAAGRAGRVKTRLLGFNGGQTPGLDPLATERERPHAPDTRFPVGWLVVVKGPGRGEAFTLQTGVAQIGRGAGQQVRLDFGDNSISRENHAAIAYDPEQKAFFIGHGGKANLVRRNGRPVLSTEEMQAGDLIVIGETTLRFAPLCGPEFSWDEGQDSSHAQASLA